MNETNVAFNEYLEEVKKLDTREKREELINSMKELIYIFQTLAKQNNIELEYLVNKEVIHFENPNATEDQFLIGALVYLETTKNVIGEYLDKKYSINEK